MTQEKIDIRKPNEEQLRNMNVRDWPIWEKEISTFDWHYDEKETCYILEGEVRVEPKEGSPVRFASGDLVTFPKGMDCVWKVEKPVRKHYKFGDD